MAYKYQVKNGSCIEVVNMMAGSKDLSKPMVDELDEVYRKARLLDDVVATTERRLSVQERKAKAFDELKVELKRKLDMESERLRRANRDLEDDDSKEYIIGKIIGQNVELMNIMTTISDMERADDER